MLTVLYILEVWNELTKDTKEIKEQMESLTEKISNMEKSNEQKYAQLEEFMIQLQINCTNPEVSIPGEWYLACFYSALHAMLNYASSLKNFKTTKLLCNCCAKIQVKFKPLKFI